MRGGVILAAFAALVIASPAPAAVRLVIGDVRAADSIASRPPGRDRDRALAAWAKHATLPELMFLLRRSPAALGGAELSMLRAALKRTPRDRAALRRRLALRLAAGSRVARRDAGAAPLRLGASVFRVACLQPDSGGYEGEGRALCAALAIGLRSWRDREGRTIDLVRVPSGDEAPAALAAAFDRAADSAAVVVGGMASASTTALAARARDDGALLTAGAMEETPGGLRRSVFQIGPAQAERGAALARAMLVGPARKRLGVLVPAGGDSALLQGFSRVADSLGTPVLWRGTYTPVAGDLRIEIGAMLAAGVELLFWDGEARDAESLMRQLAQQNARFYLCGGANLDPRRHHAAPATRGLCASWAGDEWVLDPRPMAALVQEGVPRDEGSVTRGYLAGRAIAEAVASGALAPEELVAALAARRLGDSTLARQGFLAWTTGVSIPVFTAAAGRVERVR